MALVSRASSIESRAWARITPRGVVLLLLLAMHLLANAWWLRADNHPVRTDEETHMLLAREYYSAMFPWETEDRSLAARFKALTLIKPGNPAHPPFLHIVGAMAIRVFGYGVDVLAAVNTVFFLLTLVGVYRLSRCFLGPWESVFATAATGFTPMLFAGSRFFMTDVPSMTLTVWGVYFLIKSDGLDRTGYALLFGVCLGLATLTRTVSPLYLFGPALITGTVGVWAGLRRGNHGRLWRMAAHAVLILVIAVILCGPWYWLNADRFFGFWLERHPFIPGGPVAFMDSDAPPAEQAAKEAKPLPAVTDAPTPLTPTAKASETAPATRLRWLPRRHVPWMRYPLFLINNGLFLFPFVLACAGMIAGVALRRFRCRTTACMAAWALCSFALLTLLLRIANPRYAMQFLPALAIFSALPVLALSGARLRRLAAAGYLALLGIPYVALTFVPLAPEAGVYVPAQIDPSAQQLFREPGLYLVKNTLTLSDAYSALSAPIQRNFKEELFFAMLRAEQELPKYGPEGRYLRLNMRGMLLEEPHFWPDDGFPNPFRRDDLPPAARPWRRLRDLGHVTSLDAALPLLWQADYVVYAANAEAPEEERQWLQALEPRGFSRYAHFDWPRFGRVPPQRYGILARTAPETERIVADPHTDLASWGLKPLYALRHSRAFRDLSVARRREVKDALRERAAELGPSKPLNESVSLYALTIETDGRGRDFITCVLMPEKRMDREGILVFRLVDSYGQEVIEELAPSPPTRYWVPGMPVLARYPMPEGRRIVRGGLAMRARHIGPWGEGVEIPLDRELRLPDYSLPTAGPCKEKSEAISSDIFDLGE